MIYLSIIGGVVLMFIVVGTIGSIQKARYYRHLNKYMHEISVQNDHIRGIHE